MASTARKVNAGNDVKMAAGNPDNLLKALEKRSVKERDNGVQRKETSWSSLKRLIKHVNLRMSV